LQELSSRAFHFAEKVLKKGGTVLLKVSRGGEGE
jgi:23S rRNA U2552 (ribose-2'-O)-methylase RlmE/FtsJ